MKLTTDLVVFDLEATEDHRHIIDIGAVYLNRELKVLGEFSELVNPGCALTDFIVGLTGITDEMLGTAAPFLEVADRFQAWMAELGNPRKVRLCAWGLYFDIPLLRRNFQEHGRDYPFVGTAYDVKTLAFMWAALSGRKSDKLNVSQVAKWMDIPLPEKMHRGIADARAEASILQRVMGDLDTGAFVTFPHGTVRVAITPDS